MKRTEQEQRAALRSTWVSVWVNLGLAVAQVIIGIYARSQALVADGMHTLSDLVADGLVLVAARHAHADADENHPYGHARFENAAALAIGLILLGTGVGLVWTAGIRLADGGQAGAVHPLALLTALLTLVAKEGLFHYLRRIGEQLKSSMLIANAWHARADALSSLVVAVGIGANLMGYHSMDAVAAIIVGFMIARAGWQFSVEAFHSLTDHALDAEEIDHIRKTIEAVDGVQDVHELRTRRMGDWAVIDMHVEVDPHLTVSEGHYIAEQVVLQVKAVHRVAECTVHVDPGHVRHLSRLLALPPRAVIEQKVHAVLRQPATLRLHYLEEGLEVEIELDAATDSDELERLQSVVQQALQGLERVARIAMRAGGLRDGA